MEGTRRCAPLRPYDELVAVVAACRWSSRSWSASAPRAEQAVTPPAGRRGATTRRRMTERLRACTVGDDVGDRRRRQSLLRGPAVPGLRRLRGGGRRRARGRGRGRRGPGGVPDRVLPRPGVGERLLLPGANALMRRPGHRRAEAFADSTDSSTRTSRPRAAPGPRTSSWSMGRRGGRGADEADVRDAHRGSTACSTEVVANATDQMSTGRRQTGPRPSSSTANRSRAPHPRRAALAAGPRGRVGDDTLPPGETSTYRSSPACPRPSCTSTTSDRPRRGSSSELAERHPGRRPGRPGGAAGVLRVPRLRPLRRGLPRRGRPDPHPRGRPDADLRGRPRDGRARRCGTPS